MQHRLVISRPEPLLLVAGAWVLIVALSLTGNAVVRHDRLLTGGLPLWEATGVFVAGWQVMLWAMMVPAARRISFASFALWTGFGLGLFFFDAGVHATVNRWPWLAMHPWLISGTVLVVAGTYQLSDLKARCLGRLAEGTGLDDGIACLGADWALMLLAFALGASSLAMIAAITLLMVAESRAQTAAIVKPAGYALVAIGLLVMAGPIQLPSL